MLKQILEVSIWGILPIFLAFIVFMCAIIVKYTKKGYIYSLDDISRKRKFYKTEKIFPKIDYLLEICLFMSITLSIIPLVFWFDVKYELYLCEMINNIGVVSSIVIGLTTIAMAMAVVIILFDKRYYIVFSIREVLQKYKFAEGLLIVIVSCIVVSITTLTLLNGKMDTNFDVVRFLILEIATIYNIVGVTYILYVIVIIMFFEQRRELTLLKQLYRCFWLNGIDTLQFKQERNWNKDVIDVNVEYLLEQYLNICNCKRISALNAIEFITTIDCYKKRWYHKARHKFDIMILTLFFISALIDWMVLKENCGKFVILNILVTIITIIFVYSNVQSIRMVIMRLFFDTWGYYFTTNKNKEVFIPRVPRRENVYSRYIKITNSLNAFFYIWISNVEQENSVIETEFKECIVYLYDALKKKTIVTFFPVFTIGFFMYERDIKIEELKEIYNEIIDSDNMRFDFTKMMHSQIFYLTINNGKELFNYRAKLDEYLKWMNS